MLVVVFDEFKHIVEQFAQSIDLELVSIGHFGIAIFYLFKKDHLEDASLKEVITLYHWCKEEEDVADIELVLCDITAAIDE